MQTRSTSDLARSARDLVDNVMKTGEPVQIERYRKPVAVLISPEDWELFTKLRENLPPLILGVIQDGEA